mgnify:CR=1 FL=1
MRYTFPERSIAPFLNFGVSKTFHLSSSTSWIEETEVLKVIQTEENEAFVLKNSQFGYWIGAGFKKSISSKIRSYFEFRYEITSGISDEIRNSSGNGRGSLIDSKITNLQILIGLTY